MPYDRYPDHQFRIDRRAPRGRIIKCEFAAKPGQIESSLQRYRPILDTVSLDECANYFANPVMTKPNLIPL
jgi:hypothetical protein